MYRFIFVVLVFGALSLFGAVVAEAVTVKISSVTVNPVEEGKRTGIFLKVGNYSRSGKFTPYKPTERVRIPVTFTAITAESGDYQTFGEVWLGAGSSGGGGRTISIPIDDDLEDETFRVSLGTLPTGFTAGNPSSVVITITDVGGLPTPSVSIRARAPSTTEGFYAIFTLTASSAPPSPINVGVSVTQNGNFISGSPPSSVTIGTDGYGSLKVITNDDNTDEPNGSITAKIQSGTGYTVGTSSASVTVNDNDDPPTSGGGGGGGGGGSSVNILPRVTLSVSPSQVTEGSPVTVMAHLSSALSHDVTIPLAFSRVTAEDGDYGSLSSITISAGETTGTGTLTTSKDIDLYDEVFQVTLGNLPSSVAQDSRNRVEVIISDVSKTGDFNGDGSVNSSDYALWTDAFGTQRGEAGYDEIYDLDGDGDVDIADFLIFVKNFGS